jgi:hypothetical protein
MRALLGVAAVGVIGVAMACRFARGVEALNITQGDTAVMVKAGEQLVLEYPFAGVPFKPYVRLFASPAGVNVLRDNVADHLHHHGLMYALSVDGVGFWEETPRAGKEVHKSFAGATTSSKRAGRETVDCAMFTEQLEWVGPADPKPLLKETRCIAVYRGADLGASLLTWRTTLEAGEGRAEVKLSGGHYYGLGMRFLQCMDKTGEHFTNGGPVKTAGKVFRGEERLTPGAWCAYAAEVDGKPVTAVMFDHPDNARKALWFTMHQPFAYTSATLNLHVPASQFVIKAGEPLKLCYGVAVLDGKAGAEEIEKVYKRWVELAGK